MSNKEDETPEDESTTATRLLTYTLRPDAETYRADAKRVGLEERAQLCRDLVAIAPYEHQAEAMGLILRMERSIVRETDAVETSWRAEAQCAYTTGRAQQANEELEAITGENATNPTTAAKDSPDVVH